MPYYRRVGETPRKRHIQFRGPHGTLYAEELLGAERFDETAVMVDTFHPLDLGDAAAACEDRSYAWSWARGRRDG